MTLSLAFALLGLAVTAMVARRENRKVVASRRSLLDDCAGIISEARIRHGRDGFPILEGRHGGHYLRVELIPDSMTIRRLPQLWLKLTRIEVRQHLPEFSVLVRPSGAEFYSLTTAHDVILDPPAGIGTEIVARGSCSESQGMLDGSASMLRRIFSDPRMKEVAVTARGLRLIWQAAEGARGEHLLFRQCRYESPGVDSADFANLLLVLDELGASLESANEARAA